MNTKVSYGSLPPAMIGALGVVVSALLVKAKRGEAPAMLRTLPEVIEFSDSGIWGADSVDPNVEPRVFRVSDFDGDFKLNYASTPHRAIADDKLVKFRLRRGDILVVKSSGSANQVVSGRVAVFDTDNEQAFAASNFLLRLRPKSDINPLFLAFVLGSPPIREALADSVKTMTYPNLSFRIYSQIKIPIIPLADQELVGAFFNAFLRSQPLPELPVYLGEQRRIVTRIAELAEQIDKARALRREAIEEAEAFLQSALIHLRLPKNSTTMPIAQCSTMSTGTTPPSHRSDYYGGQIQWYTPGDLEYHQRLGKSTRTLSETALAERKARMFEPGTVLLVAIGGSLGKVALTHERCSANQQITGIKFSNDVLPEYGFWWMRRLGKDLMAAAPQATLPIINQDRIGAIEISIPPISEQRRIVDKLDAIQAKVNELKRLQDETSREMDAMLPSILDKAFKGEL